MIVVGAAWWCGGDARPQITRDCLWADNFNNDQSMGQVLGSELQKCDKP
jgi:hypothetical protein